MSWNHRVHKLVQKRKTGPSETTYSIREVYYDGRGKPNGYSLEPRPAFGNTINELRECLSMMLAATFKPVLRYKHERKGRWTK